MANRRGRPKKKQLTIKSRETSITLGTISIILAGLIALSFFVESSGFLIFKQFLGLSAIFASLFFLNLSLRYFGVDTRFNAKSSLFLQFFLVFLVAGLLSAVNYNSSSSSDSENLGGIIGYSIFDFAANVLSIEGAIFVLLVLAVAFLVLGYKLSLRFVVNFVDNLFKFFSKLFKKVGEIFNSLFKSAGNIKFEKDEKKLDEKGLNEKGKLEQDKRMVGDLHIGFGHPKEQNDIKDNSKTEDNEKGPLFRNPLKRTMSEEDMAKIKFVETQPEQAFVNEELAYPDWKLPAINLLDPYTKRQRNDVNISKNGDIIEETLDSFGIQAKVVEVNQGPRVTQYALNIALGTKVSKIANLKTDLALALAAPSGAIRIEAPIPGTSYIGIETPNTNPDTVRIKEVMETLLMKQKDAKLGVVVGKNIAGQNIITDLQKMPHLLVAGATGSGKSVVTNSFIISLLMSKTPDEVRFIMVDPKQVELSFYNGIPHLLTPVITDMDKVTNALKWAIAEMERRYTLFRQAKVKNIEGYNTLMGFSAIPYIVIVMDEMADLMLTKGVDIENSIVRLAQKARATGIHLVLATQRPSVDVITGLIKANIPGRIGLSVATQIDSRVIIDLVGAETLLGKGDMLFKEPDKSRPFRIQGVWVSEEEIARVVNFIKDQVPEVQYTKEITESMEVEAEASASGEYGELSDDDLFKDAVSVVINLRKASASMLQRKLKIGYNRAARLIDEMYEAGIVGPPDGSKPRDVLISDISQIYRGGDESVGEDNRSQEQESSS